MLGNGEALYEFTYKGVGVTVKASFTPIEAEDIWKNPFTDVKEGDWSMRMCAMSKGII